MPASHQSVGIERRRLGRHARLIFGGLFLALPMARAQNVGTLTTLAQNTITSGQEFAASLVQGSDGNFYGTASDGGPITDSHGTVFRITPTGAVINLYSFSGPDGFSPQAGLLLASDGNFYGTTTLGGSTYVDSNNTGDGTVFRITPAGVLTTLHSFTGYPGDGQAPKGTLIQGSDGNFYGTTSGGGTYGGGTLFQMTPVGVVTTLYSFGNGYEGSEVDAGVVQGSDGAFYGTTRLGGNGAGAVFQVTPSGAYTTLYSFPALGTTAGADPVAALVQGSDGSFYGTTETTGMNGAGTVFKITPAGDFTNLYSFSGSDQFLMGALIQASDGNFYGTTTGGGTDGGGAIFEITPAGTVATIYSFTGDADGGYPAAALVQGNDGNFYGTTLTGGSGNDGTIFELTLAADVTVAPAVVTATILGNGATVEGGQVSKVLVQRTGGDATSALTVLYKVKGTAKSGVDYKPVTGTVIIPAGATQIKLKLKTIADPAVNGTLVAKVKLLAATDGSYTRGSPAVAKIKISDGD